MALESRLLGLPRELRDIIFAFAILDEQPIRVKSKIPAASQQGVTGCLASSSSLLLVNKQIHDEYFQALYTAVRTPEPKIKLQATVNDMRFDSIIHFINQLSHRQVEVFSSGYRVFSNGAGFRIELVVGPYYPPYELADKLKKWLVFCEHTGVIAKYEVEGAPGYENDSFYLMRLVWMHCVFGPSRFLEGEESRKAYQKMELYLRRAGRLSRSFESTSRIELWKCVYGCRWSMIEALGAVAAFCARLR